jgi:LacI family transcriptional regulator
MRTAAEFGLKIPHDLSVIGFDNVPESALTHPPLTTVAQPIQTLGYEAVRLLITLIEQPDKRLDPPTRVALPTELVVRGSTAPPRRVPS